MGGLVYVEEEDIFSLSEMEAGLLGKNGDRCMKGFPPPPSCSDLFHEAFYEQPGYFLGTCFLCKKKLRQNMDIFMYRGDTPFCSEECRQEQIDVDEAVERNRILYLRIPPSNPSNSKGKFSDFLQRVGSILAG